MNLEDVFEQIEQHFAKAWVNSPEVTIWLEQSRKDLEEERKALEDAA